MLFEGLPTEPATGSGSSGAGRTASTCTRRRSTDRDLRVVPGDLDPPVLDVVVVPGLAFTADGRRLGQGGGHYDRFLPRLRADCVTVGACFAEQVVTSIPTLDHDIRVDHVASA